MLLGMVYAISATAQQPITLSAAVDTAMKNNLMVKNEILNAAYQEKLKAGAVDIPQTSLTGEFGQFNSSYKDNKFGISQSISFPTVYAKQKSLQHENYIRSVLNIAVKEAELRKQVSELFYMLVYLELKQKLLLHNDSVYATFLEKVNMRFAEGESDILEKLPQRHKEGRLLYSYANLRTMYNFFSYSFSCC